MTNDKDLWSGTNEILDKIKSYAVFILIARSEKIIYVPLTGRWYNALKLRVLLRRPVYKKRPTECIYLTEVAPKILQEYNFHTN